ncbi:MAG: glycosyltransferase family 2 protein [Tidjanibacter sp.]|nr:glycosyltransferase family 2 protein [Tidjanibacter sp.]
MTPSPRISLVIATYNGASRIEATLQSLLSQELESGLWEAVVVNNNSADDTAGVVEAFIVAHPEVQIVLAEEKNQGLSYARNRGIEVSRGEIIAIIDDDEIASPRLLADYLRFFDTHPGVVAAGGRIVPLYESGRPEWMCGLTERPIAGTLDLGERECVFPEGKYFGGGNMAIRRSAIERYGAFDPALGRRGTLLLGGEEKDLYMRLHAAGEQIYYLPTASIQHVIPDAKLTRDYFERVCFRIGQSERVRTQNARCYGRRWVAEVVKWVATLVLGVLHIVSLHPSRAKYLWIMRRQISRGLAAQLPK